MIEILEGCYEGPGCSSVGAGAFCEHGPFKPSGNILVRNDYSWNKGSPTNFSGCRVRVCSQDNILVNGKDLMCFSFFLQRQTCYTWNHRQELDSRTPLINLSTSR